MQKIVRLTPPVLSKKVVVSCACRAVGVPANAVSPSRAAARAARSAPKSRRGRPKRRDRTPFPVSCGLPTGPVPALSPVPSTLSKRMAPPNRRSVAAVVGCTVPVVAHRRAGHDVELANVQRELARRGGRLARAVVHYAPRKSWGRTGGGNQGRQGPAHGRPALRRRHSVPARGQHSNTQTASPHPSARENPAFAR